MVDFQVDKIDNRLRDTLDLRVTILLDYLRGTRGERLEKSSTTLLKRIADRSTVRFVETKKPENLQKKLHIKIITF